MLSGLCRPARKPCPWGWGRHTCWKLSVIMCPLPVLLLQHERPGMLVVSTQVRALTELVWWGRATQAWARDSAQGLWKEQVQIRSRQSQLK